MRKRIQLLLKGEQFSVTKLGRFFEIPRAFRRLGIEPEYVDVYGQRQVVAAGTIERILRIMRTENGLAAPSPYPSVIVARQGHPARLDLAGLDPGTPVLCDIADAQGSVAHCDGPAGDCRLPDNPGLDHWDPNCLPTRGLQNPLRDSTVNPPTSGGEQPLCPIADTLPDDFVLAECLLFGGNIWNPAYWDEFGWYGERFLPESPGKWNVFVD